MSGTCGAAWCARRPKPPTSTPAPSSGRSPQSIRGTGGHPLVWVCSRRGGTASRGFCPPDSPPSPGGGVRVGGLPTSDLSEPQPADVRHGPGRSDLGGQMDRHPGRGTASLPAVGDEQTHGLRARPVLSGRRAAPEPDASLLGLCRRQPAPLFEQEDKLKAPGVCQPARWLGARRLVGGHGCALFVLRPSPECVTRPRPA